MQLFARKPPKLAILSADWLDYAECGSLLYNNCLLFTPIKMSTNEILETALKMIWECGEASSLYFHSLHNKRIQEGNISHAFNVFCFIMTFHLIFQHREPRNPIFQGQREEQGRCQTAHLEKWLFQGITKIFRFRQRVPWLAHNTFFKKYCLYTVIKPD